MDMLFEEDKTDIVAESFEAGYKLAQEETIRGVKEYLNEWLGDRAKFSKAHIFKHIDAYAARKEIRSDE